MQTLFLWDGGRVDFSRYQPGPSILIYQITSPLYAILSPVIRICKCYLENPFRVARVLINIQIRTAVDFLINSPRIQKRRKKIHVYLGKLQSTRVRGTSMFQNKNPA